MADLNNPSIHPTTSNPLPLASTNDHPAAGPRTIMATAPKPKAKPPHATDSTREVIETIVFVVVLVLLLKSFVAEAFVIPTGSMATTLLGYQKDVPCPKCGFEFPVNCSSEVEEKPPRAVVGAVCPNCRYPIHFQSERIDPACSSGDRVLVAKYLYDSGLIAPNRFNVVVFKYPEAPQRDNTPLNYIKRLIGLPGETIGIHYGKLYVLPADKIPKYPEDANANPLDLWHKMYMHQGDAEALLLQLNSPFEILRKPLDVLLAEKRIVYDNNHPATDLNVSRWQGEAGSSWKADDKHGFDHAAGGDRLEWLRYQNILRGRDRPELITDFLGYNSKETGEQFRGATLQGGNWVGDLILECDVTVEKSEGELVLELAKGVDRFRATWDLSSGKCTLSRLHDGKEEQWEGGSKPTSLTKPGTYHVRFANVDERLIVWVDKSVPFGDGVIYSAPPDRAPTAYDLQPASIGAHGGAVHVHNLTLWRDTYYTYQPKGSPNPAWADSAEVQHAGDTLHELLSDPGRFQDAFRNLPATTYYVQPGHYLCLGDNSPESSDGRSWGLVPQRLLLGRALLVYYPFWPFGLNRAGPIK
jgi:signal peptidase I